LGTGHGEEYGISTPKKCSLINIQVGSTRRQEEKVTNTS